MKSIQKLYKWIFLMLTWLVLGCEKETYEFGDLIPPSNLVVSTEIIGQDADNPYGDGSGAVIFTANASDVITYKFFYDGNEELVPSGKTTINFSTTGIHKYAVTVVAMGAAGNQTSETVEVEVLAEYEPPADLIEMLTGGSSRSWRVKAESAGHMGVGPPDADSPIWWAAGPYDKAQTAMYDDEYIFNILTCLQQGQVRPDCHGSNLLLNRVCCILPVPVGRLKIADDKQLSSSMRHSCQCGDAQVKRLLHIA